LIIFIAISFEDAFHGIKILLLSGFVRKPRITPGDLHAAVAQQLPQTLKGHGGIQQIGGKGVSQTVQTVAAVLQAGFLQTLFKYTTRSFIR
jgi:hypothetical protein